MIDSHLSRHNRGNLPLQLRQFAVAYQELLLGGGLARKEFDLAAAEVELVGQQLEDGGVGLPFLRGLGDQHNKLAAGLDALAGRPTVLLALALEALSPAKQEELLSLMTDSAPGANASGSPGQRLTRVRQLYNEAGVFDKAHKLVDKHQQRAEQIADGLEPEELRRLFYYLIDTVLERPTETPVPVLPVEMLSGLDSFQMTTH